MGNRGQVNSQGSLLRILSGTSWRRLIKNQLRGSLSLKRKRLNVPETREPCSVKAIRSSVHCSISYVP